MRRGRSPQREPGLLTRRRARPSPPSSSPTTTDAPIPRYRRRRHARPLPPSPAVLVYKGRLQGADRVCRGAPQRDAQLYLVGIT